MNILNGSVTRTILEMITALSFVMRINSRSKLSGYKWWLCGRGLGSSYNCGRSTLITREIVALYTVEAEN
jgi:hypothetical protein